MNILNVTTTSKSWAFQIGQRDAQDGASFAPESWFASPTQKREYALGFESVKGVTTITAAFTGSAVPAPVVVEAAPAPVAAAIVVPQYKRNTGKEFVRRTDSNVDAIFSAAERHWRMIDKMMAADPSGEMLWAS